MKKFIYIFFFIVLGGLCLRWISSCDETDRDNSTAVTTVTETTGNALAILADTHNPHATAASEPMDSMPDDGCIRLKTYPPSDPLAKALNDSNYLHYQAAEQLGISPITDDITAWKLRRPLLNITSCREFYVAPLTHSYAYLVPEASKLLHDIGRTFNDTLAARGGGNYRLKVTSLLRTSGSVRKLRRVNRCATDSSAHQFGTTFDISYTRFMLTDHGGVHRTQEDLKNLLAEIVADMRAKGRCYVKYERKSGCMHITTRPTPDNHDKPNP